MGVGAAEAIVVLIWLVVPLLVLAAVYWVVRLGVRDGMSDARRDRGQQPGPAATGTPEHP